MTSDCTIPGPSVLISCITRESIHAQTAQWLANQRYEVDIVQLPYTIAHNRNVQVERFLATKHEYIFIVDADVLPQPDTIERLLSHRGAQDILVAPCLTFDGKGQVCVMA